MDKLSVIKKNFEKAAQLKQQLLSDATFLQHVADLAEAMVSCYQNKGKVLLCGNGGSAADAQHLAAELSGRYYYDRPPLSSEALHVNTSYLTAVANDYSFDEVYARLVKATGNQGDILIGLSTSGNSPNVVRALKQAKEQEMITVGMTGEDGGAMKDFCDFMFRVPSTDTPRIQEVHMLIGHTLCEMVEQALFPK